MKDHKVLKGLQKALEAVQEADIQDKAQDLSSELYGVKSKIVAIRQIGKKYGVKLGLNELIDRLAECESACDELVCAVDLIDDRLEDLRE